MSLQDIKEFNKNLTMTWAFYVLSLVAVAVGSWYVSDIHTRFQLQDVRILTLQIDFASMGERMTNEIKAVNERMDRKHDRQQEDIEKEEKRINILEKPGSDK